MNLSVLQNFKNEDLHLDPFPYICIENALPTDLYNQLADEYPESVLENGPSSFSDFRYCQEDFDDKIVSPLWKKFVEFHTSKEYKDQLINILKPALEKYYPEIVEKYLNSDVCLRHQAVRGALRLEVQFVMNSPDTKSIRTPHLDQGRELFACLFYFKKPEDTSTGGDLIIYKKAVDPFIFNSGRIAPIEDIEEVDRVQYKANTLAVFLNTPDSIHGVSQRIEPKTIRRYVNIDGHVEEKLFRL